MNLRATPVSSLANLGPHKPRLCHATDCSHTREVSSYSWKLLGSPSQQGTPSFDFSILRVFSISLRLLPWAAQAAQAFQNSLDLSQTPLQARLRYHASGQEALDSQHCKCWESYEWRGTSASNRAKIPTPFVQPILSRKMRCLASEHGTESCIYIYVLYVFVCSTVCIHIDRHMYGIYYYTRYIPSYSFTCSLWHLPQ